MTEQKVYGFLAYHAHRCKKLKDQRVLATDPLVIRFDRNNYDKVMVKTAEFDH